MLPMPRSRAAWRWLGALALIAGGLAAGLQATAAPPGPAQYIPLVSRPALFQATLDGDPASPQSWQPRDWDVTIHSRDTSTWAQLEPMQADHGADCGPAPASHTISRYEDAVFLCRNHVMTAIKASGYGVIYLTPNQQVDFSGGVATVRFDMSTLRTSGRDWVDLWITPYADNLQLPLDMVVDLSGPPRNAVQVRMDINHNTFSALVYRNFQPTLLPSVAVPYDAFLATSATRRDTFELRISRTSVSFGMPAYGFSWVNASLADLGWDRGVVQLGHHSYNPLKDCTDPCAPGTWHWDNLAISPHRPFTIIRASRRFVDARSTAVTLDAPAPAGARLRFAGIGPDIQVRFNGGAWQPAQIQSHDRQYLVDEHFRSYWTPIPAGTTRVEFRGGATWWAEGWHVRDISVWANP